MLIENVPISSITISIGIVISIIILAVPAYIALAIKNFLLKMENVIDKVNTNKKDLEKYEKSQKESVLRCDKMHEDHYGRIHDLETIQAVLKTELDNDHERGKK